MSDCDNAKKLLVSFEVWFHCQFTRSWLLLSGLHMQKATDNGIAELVAAMSTVHEQTNMVSSAVVSARFHLTVQHK